jgi:dihydroflavonol-4-reductase
MHRSSRGWPTWMIANLCGARQMENFYAACADQPLLKIVYLGGAIALRDIRRVRRATTGRLIVEIANRTLPGYVKGNRNVIYAGDAGRGLVRVCEQGRPGERYLLTGENISMSDLVTKIAQIAGAPVPRAIPIAIARVASALQTARYKWLKGPLPRVDATAIAVMSAGQFVNGAKARSELGFTATETLDNTIRRALVWFRSNGYVKQPRW